MGKFVQSNNKKKIILLTLILSIFPLILVTPRVYEVFDSRSTLFWKTYESNIYDISFKYPKDWDLFYQQSRKGTPNNELIVGYSTYCPFICLPSLRGPHGFSIEFEEFKGSIDEYIKYRGWIIISKEDYKINNKFFGRKYLLNVRKRTIEVNEKPYFRPESMVIVSRNDKIYMFDSQRLDQYDITIFSTINFLDN